jgi:hypothetical protein
VPREPVAGAEISFLGMCLAEGDRGRAHLERLEPEHLSSDALRHVAAHLLAHWDDPLAAVPADDPELAALVAELLVRAGSEPSSEHALRISSLQLRSRWVDRELRRASGGRSFERERELWPVREGVRREIAELMRAAG